MFKGLTRQHGLFTLWLCLIFEPKLLFILAELCIKSPLVKAKDHHYSLCFLMHQNRIIQAASTMQVTLPAASCTGSLEKPSYLDI